MNAAMKKQRRIATLKKIIGAAIITALFLLALGEPLKGVSL